MLARLLMCLLFCGMNFFGIFPEANCNQIDLKLIGIRSETRINKGDSNVTHGGIRIKSSKPIPEDENSSRVVPPIDRARVLTTASERNDQVVGKYDGTDPEEAEVEDPADIVYVEHSEDSTRGQAVQVGYDGEAKATWHKAHKKLVQKKPPLKKNNLNKTANKICDKVKKPQTAKRKILKNKEKQQTTTSTENNVQATTTKRYKGAVIAFQPAYQVFRNKLKQGLASTLFPYLTGEDVVGPVYGTVPLFPPPAVSPSAGSIWSRLWSWQKTT